MSAPAQANGVETELSVAGTKRKIVLSILLALISSLSIIYVLKTLKPVLAWDAKDIAQVARQVERGKGLTSKATFPEAIPASNTDPSQWPDVMRSPALVYLEALFFRFFGVSDLSATMCSALFSFGTVLAIFWLVEPVFGLAIAFISAAAFAVSPACLLYAANGLTEPLAMFFLTLAVALVLRPPTAGRVAAAGLCLSACALSRPIAALWAIVLVFVAWRQWRGQSRVALLVVFLAAFIAPFEVITHTLKWHGGNTQLGMVLALHTDASLSDAIRSPVSFVVHHLGLLAKKSVVQFGRPVVYLFGFGGIPIFSALSVFGLMMCQDGDRPKALRDITVLLVIFNAIALAPLHEGDGVVGPLRYFDVFAPLMIGWGVAALWIIRPHIPRALFASTLVLFLAFQPVQLAKRGGLKMDPAVQLVYRDLSSLVPPDDVIATSAVIESPAIAWYGDRYAIQAADPNVDIPSLRNRGMRVNWYLATERDGVPASFSLAKAWPSGQRLWRVSYAAGKP